MRMQSKYHESLPVLKEIFKVREACRDFMLASFTSLECAQAEVSSYVSYIIFKRNKDTQNFSTLITKYNIYG